MVHAKDGLFDYIAQNDPAFIQHIIRSGNRCPLFRQEIAQPATPWRTLSSSETLAKAQGCTDRCLPSPTLCPLSLGQSVEMQKKAERRQIIKFMPVRATPYGSPSIACLGKPKAPALSPPSPSPRAPGSYFSHPQQEAWAA